MVGIAVGVGLLTLCAVVSVWRMFKGPGDADRALASDLFFFTVIGLFGLLGLVYGTVYVFDLILMGTVLGMLATISMARSLTNGRR